MIYIHGRLLLLKYKFRDLFRQIDNVCFVHMDSPCRRIGKDKCRIKGNIANLRTLKNRTERKTKRLGPALNFYLTLASPAFFRHRKALARLPENLRVFPWKTLRFPFAEKRSRIWLYGRTVMKQCV